MSGQTSPGSRMKPTVYSHRTTAAIALALTGCAASIASLFATPVEGLSPLACGIEALSCDVALTSQFSHIAGVPLGVFGLFYFTLWTLTLSASLLTGFPLFRVCLSYLSLVGGASSIALGFIMLGILKAPCLYCLLSHFSNLVAFTLVWPLLSWRLPCHPKRREWFLLLTLLLTSALASTTLFFYNESRTLSAQIEESKQTLW